MILASAAVSLGIASVGLLSNAVAMGAVLALTGVIGGYNNVVLISWVQARVEPNFMGRVMGVLMFCWTGLLPVSYPLAGALAQWSVSRMFLTCGLAGAAVAALAATAPDLRRVQ